MSLTDLGKKTWNPSVDVKAWHVHAQRELIEDKFASERSYHSVCFDPNTRKPLFQKYLPIEPLKRWKLYTTYSESHERLYRDWFLATLQDDFEIMARRLDQSCESAEFYEKGWVKTVLNKIPLILEAIDSGPENSFFIFSDVDIQFFSPIQGEIRKLLSEQPSVDIFFQQDAIKDPSGKPNLCTGFFVCKANAKTRLFWTMVGARMREKERGDQDSANYIWKAKLVQSLRLAFLPVSFWATNSAMTSPTRWEPGLYLEMPEGILLHHANWTVGVSNKIAQLEYIKRKKNLLDFKARRFPDRRRPASV